LKVSKFRLALSIANPEIFLLRDPEPISPACHPRSSSPAAQEGSQFAIYDRRSVTVQENRRISFCGGLLLTNGTIV
jgi:hypothetical protein